MATLQHLPHLGTADADVLLVDWLVEVGSAVTAGQPIATIETLKAAFEVEADVAGFVLRTLCEAGQRVAAHAPIAVLGAAGDASDDAVVAELLAAARDRIALPTSAASRCAASAPVAFSPSLAGDAPVAPAARRRASELGVDLARVHGSGPDGLIRVADVELAAAAEHPAAGAVGTVDPAFVALLRSDRSAFAALSSDAKLHLYRKHGATLGHGCRFAPGALLLADRIVLGDAASFGRDTVVEARTLRAGNLLHFGARCRVRATRLEFGDNAFFADDVEIGGGGALDPEAALLVGSHGFVGEHAHLNPCRTLRLGDEVVISRQAALMTHSFGPSWLRGYPSRFADTTVGDGAQIGIAAVLFPGVQVGPGAVVLSGSSVVTDVPAGRLFGGVPATDQKAAAQRLTSDELQERAHQLVREFARQLELRSFRVVVRDDGSGCVVDVAHGDGLHRLEYRPASPFGPSAGGATIPTAHRSERVLVALTFADADYTAVPSDLTAIGLEPPRVRGPLGPLAAAFREFLRKRGIRLEPRSWAYTGGWL